MDFGTGQEQINSFFYYIILIFKDEVGYEVWRYLFLYEVYLYVMRCMEKRYLYHELYHEVCYDVCMEKK